MNPKEKILARKLINNPEAKRFLKITQVWGGSTRFKIILLLGYYKRGFTVTELAEILNSSLSRISHQLSILRKNKFVTASGTNREKIYKVSEQFLVKDVLHLVCLKLKKVDLKI